MTKKKIWYKFIRCQLAGKLFTFHEASNSLPFFTYIDPPKERPRLNLKPRTDRAESSEESEGTSKSSIFGSAKPVDTAKKEAEIDQKLQVR